MYAEGVTMSLRRNALALTAYCLAILTLPFSKSVAASTTPLNITVVSAPIGFKQFADPGFDFGSISIGTIASLVIDVGGGQPGSWATISWSIVGSPDFAISNNTCIETLNYPSICSLQINFRPSSAGPQSATLYEAVNGFDGTDNYSYVATYTLTGVGVNGTLQPVNSSDSCNQKASSSINMDTLAISEAIPVVGAPFNLNYSSNRFQSGFSFSMQTLGLGGWAPNIVHHYDIANQIFYAGDGGSRSVTAVANGSGYFIASQNATEVYYFDSNGVHLQTKDALTGVSKFTFSYAPQGNLSSITDQFGNVTSIQYSSGQAIISSPYGRLTQLTFDSNGFLASVTNPNSETYTLTNSSTGFLLSLQKPGGQMSQKSYDSNGYLTQDLGAGGNSINLTRTFDVSTLVQSVTSTTTLGRQTFYQTTSSGSASTHEATQPTGEVFNSVTPDLGAQSSTDSLGITTSANMVADPRFGSMSPYAQTSSTVINNSSIDILIAKTIQATLSNPNDPLSLTTLSTQTVLQNDPTRTFVSTYTANNRSLATTSPLNRKVTSILNSFGEPQSNQIGSLTPLTFDYDAHGRLTNLNQGPSRKMILTYDKNGNVASSTDFLNHMTSYQYDNAGRVIQQTNPNGSVISFSYDKNGNLISLTPPSRPTYTFNYNLFELLSNFLPPSLGGVSSSVNYSYNLDEQLTQISLPTGDTLNFTYDSTTGLLTNVALPNGNLSYVYEPNSNLPEAIVSPDQEILVYSYLGNIVQCALTYGLVNGNVCFTYNTDGTLASIFPFIVNTEGAVMQEGTMQTLSYDKDGLVVGAGDLAMNHDQNGLVVTSTLQNVNESLSYDSFGQISEDDFSISLTTSKHTQKFNIYDRSLTRDNLGRIIDIKHAYFAPYCGEPFWGLPENKYVYDSLGRLTEALDDHAPLRKYVYDENGNRIQKITGFQVTEGHYNDQDQLIQYGHTFYTYDANGALSQKSVNDSRGGLFGGLFAELLSRVFDKNDSGRTKITKYQFDAFSNLKFVTLPDGRVISYIVDGQNRRVGKQINGTLVQGFIYNSQTQIIAELDGSGNIVKQFIYGMKQNIPDYMITNGKEYRIISNQVGTPIYVVDASSGQVVEFENMDEFGYSASGEMATMASASSASNSTTSMLPFGFAGGLYDGDTGLVHMGAREYDPETGRWLQRDPILFNIPGTVPGATGPVQTNLYAYTLNDPINFIDPTGLFLTGPQWAGIIGGAVGGAASGAIIGSGIPVIGTGGGAIIGGIFGAIIGGTLGPYLPALLPPANATELPPQFQVPPNNPLMCKP
jgi:RHS repeat-associated protein